MSVLGDAVFMALAAIDAGGAEAIVVQQGGVIVVQRAAAAAFHLVGGSRGIVAAQYRWNAAQGPEGILQSLLQGREGLTGGNLGVAPPRVAEYQLEQQITDCSPATTIRSRYSLGGRWAGGCASNARNAWMFARETLIGARPEELAFGGGRKALCMWVDIKDKGECRDAIRQLAESPHGRFT